MKKARERVIFRNWERLSFFREGEEASRWERGSKEKREQRRGSEMSEIREERLAFSTWKCIIRFCLQEDRSIDR